MSKHSLDARGLLCPIPVIRAQELARTLTAGDLVELVATDPGVMHDVPAWCRVHGHDVITSKEQDDEYLIQFKIGTG
ncbi:MAG: sulfurtransferase TusA family protein [Gammaproteobacteria bacterium]|nr:sulfurtransferase TusA family protein [Gammaproteobacteria bacterium]MCY4200938.1 sulfurtransferase TusA family protein [Gammaproteobacteria bacterium]MCY4279075.1 sulfurtransferase TusA family protein [Gammaproteobacteria bacterium]MCY4323410.1 sulfurtransferase TusA family protein [Gammaproteobacteria bacterium]